MAVLCVLFGNSILFSLKVLVRGRPRPLFCSCTITGPALLVLLMALLGPLAIGMVGSATVVTRLLVCSLVPAVWDSLVISFPSSFLVSFLRKYSGMR